MKKLLTRLTLLLIGFAVAGTNLYSCKKEVGSEPEPVGMTIRWDKLPAQFVVSDIGRIGITTAGKTLQYDVDGGGRFYPQDTPAQIESVTVYFSGDRGSIRVEGSEVTVSETTLTITRDLSDVTLFVYDRTTLDKVRDNLAGNYLQIRDVDLSDADWTPIGDWDNRFTGTYDGGGLAIHNMTVEISASGNVYAGLFGVNSGALRNIRLEGGSVSAESTGNLVYCGGVCGQNYKGSITACSNTGNMNGTAGQFIFCGGVCGSNFQGSITACYNTGSVSEITSNQEAYCGGLCGSNFQGAITACYNTGSVSTTTQNSARFGGLCGENLQGTITACFNTGVVNVIISSGTALCGGVCGNNSGSITACFNTGSVSGEGGIAYCGGVSGYNANDCTIIYCYWGGASASLDKAVENEYGVTTETYKFGADAWPSSSLPGWGGTAPANWDETSLGAWPDPWKSLGGWNGGNPTFPALR